MQAITNVARLTNKSGGVISKGQAVRLDTGNDFAVTTTTTAGDYRTVGVALGDVANNASGLFLCCWSRLSDVFVDAAVTRGHYLKHSTTAGKLTTTGTLADATTVPPSGSVAVALEAAGGAGQIDVLWFGLTASGAVADEGITSRLFAPTVIEDECSADTTINSGVDTDITGLSISVTPAIASVALVWGYADIIINTIDEVFDILLDVDGANEASFIRFQQARGTLHQMGSQIWVVPLTAAAHTLKMQGVRTVGGSTASVKQTHTRMALMLIGNDNVTMV